MKIGHAYLEDQAGGLALEQALVLEELVEQGHVLRQRAVEVGPQLRDLDRVRLRLLQHLRRRRLLDGDLPVVLCRRGCLLGRRRWRLRAVPLRCRRLHLEVLLASCVLELVRGRRLAQLLHLLGQHVVLLNHPVQGLGAVEEHAHLEQHLLVAEALHDSARHGRARRQRGLAPVLGEACIRRAVGVEHGGFRLEEPTRVLQVLHRGRCAARGVSAEQALACAADKTRIYTYSIPGRRSRRTASRPRCPSEDRARLSRARTLLGRTPTSPRARPPAGRSP